MKSTSAAERAQFAAIALLVAEEAGALVSAGFRSRPVAELKGKSDLVTQFDRASEDMLVARLSSLAPGIPVVGEERGESSSNASNRAGLIWYVDPLDGTTNFVHGHPFWSIAVGLMDGDEPIAGAVVAPALGLRWSGWVGDPVSAVGRPGRPGEARRNGQRCGVSATAKIEDALLATGFPPVRTHAPTNNFHSFMSVKHVAQAVRRCGSAAIDLCMVADGTYDGYWERKLHIWDVAAGSALVLAARGRITALDGSAPNYHVGHIVASNGLIHDALVEAVNA
ncbi:inositol monophosphatase family protein [Polyangium aurulentum]|uniref:inositol monophosphatase family protein n=1 Tax=Polyangium aurulentum TaxID=2567896 RepID=UPI0010AE3D71|nr:inositol monophosphatase family protein [Polyangium aurulentum]UQA61590.1 inositol monophosphatase [Polyangium aurulentum]